MNENAKKIWIYFEYSVEIIGLMDSKRIEFTRSTDSWICYVWTQYYLQIVDSTIHETFI